MPQTATASTDRLVFSERDLDTHGVLSRKTRWRLRREGKFPEPREIGGRKLYLGSEIHAWLEDPEGWVSRRAEEGA